MKQQQTGGFSIVEVLVATSLLIGLAVGITKLTQDQLKSTKTVETKFEYGAIINDIRQILGNQESCMATLGGFNAKSTTNGITEIKRFTPTGNVSRYKANLSYGNGTINISSFQLSATDTDPGVNVSNDPAVRGTTNLIVTFDLGNKKTFSSRYISKDIRINVATTGTPDFKITECSSTGELADLEDRYVNANEDDVMDGNLTITDGHSIIMASDSSLKHDIQALGPVMEKMRNVRPVTYRWNRDNSESIGFIAQEIQPVFPHLVDKKSNDYLTVNYISMIPVLVKAIKEMDEENKHLKIEQEKIKDRLDMITKEICHKNKNARICRIKDNIK